MTNHRVAVVILSGGIGNQLFQYLFAKAYCEKFGRKLYVEDKIGFFIDRTYRRKYQLNEFILSLNKPPLYYRAKYFVNLALKKYISVDVSRKLSSINILSDSCSELELDFRFQNFDDVESKLLYIKGYFQSPLYFNGIIHTNRPVMKFKEELKGKYKNIYESIRNQNSLAVCIRLYEEVQNPNIMFKNKTPTTLDKFYSLLRKVKDLHEMKDNYIYIFTSSEKKHLNIPKDLEDIRIINPENGYDDPIQVLQLLTHFEKQIISASTYYWWGAFLAGRKNQRNGSGSRVYVADNFLNQDIYMPNWTKF